MRVRFVLALLVSLSSARAAEFRHDDPEHAFPELKVYDAAGHPWRSAREDWAGARNRVAVDPAWTRWLASEKAAVDRWRALHPRDHVEWTCGWWHDFVSPKDGSYLTWTDEIPGVQAQFLHSPSDPRVEITPKIMGGWVFGFRSRHAEMIRRAARLYRLTGDETYAAWAATQLDFYAAHLTEWPLSSRGCRLFWQTLDEATTCITYAEAVRLLGDYATAERRDRWHHHYFDPTVALLNRTMLTIHNIATWQRCAAAVVALVFQDDGLWRQAIDGRYGLRRQLAEGVTSDYLWYEQSLGYNSYVVRAVLTLFTAAGLQGRGPELANEMAVAENLMLAPVYLRWPDGRTPNPADATATLNAPDRGVFSDVYRVFPTTVGLAVAAGRRDWDTLLDPPPPSPRPVALPAVKSWNLESSRMAVLRDGAWQVFLHYGQLTRSHSQSEALNFAAYLGDVDLTHDPGTVGYGSRLHQQYYTKGLNHNVALIDGEGELPPQAGELVSFTAARVVANQPHYLPNASVRRELGIEGGALTDRLAVQTTGGPHRLGFALHLQGRVALPSSFAPDTDFARARPDAFGYWQDVTAEEYRDRVEFEVAYENGTRLRIAIHAPGAFRVWHGSAPDAPPRRRDALLVELAQPAVAAEFVTTFTPVK